jgi:hypothetical protein
MRTRIDTLNFQSLLAPFLSNLSNKEMSFPTVHAQVISAAPITAVSAVPIDDNFEFDEDQMHIGCDFIEYVDTDKPVISDAVYTINSSDVYICDDFDEWLEENLEPAHDTPVVPIASTVPQNFYCGQVEGPPITKAEYYDKDVEEKIAKMQGLCLSDKDKIEDADMIFAEIIDDFASESYRQWYAGESTTKDNYYYAECEVGGDEDLSNSICPEYQSEVVPGAFCLGSEGISHSKKEHHKPHTERSLDLTEQKKKHRVEAIQKWKQKRQDKLAEKRLLDARQIATSKRTRTNGKFAKRKINWVSITEASS